MPQNVPHRREAKAGNCGVAEYPNSLAGASPLFPYLAWSAVWPARCGVGRPCGPHGRPVSWPARPVSRPGRRRLGRVVGDGRRALRDVSASQSSASQCRVAARIGPAPKGGRGDPHDVSMIARNQEPSWRGRGAPLIDFSAARPNYTVNYGYCRLDEVWGFTAGYAFSPF